MECKQLKTLAFFSLDLSAADIFFADETEISSRKNCQKSLNFPCIAENFGYLKLCLKYFIFKL